MRRVIASPLTPWALVAGFVGLVAWQIGKNSTWFDESYSVMLVAPNGLRAIAARTALDGHPPLWYWAAKLVFAALGESVFALRVSSAVFMVAALAAWFRFFATRFSRGLGVVGLGLMACNPMVLHYAIEGRMYALGVLLAAATSLLVTSARRWRWIAYWPLAVAMLYTHYFLAFVVGAQFVYLLIERRERAWWVVAYGASIVVAFTPWLSIAAHQSSAIVHDGFWVPALTAIAPVQFIDQAFLHHADGELIGWHAVATLVFDVAWIVAFVRAMRVRAAVGTREPIALLWALVAVPWVCLTVLSCLFVPVVLPRYVVFGLPAVIALLAIGARQLAARWTAIVGAVLVAGSLYGVSALAAHGATGDRGRWSMRQIAALVAEPVDGEVPWVVADFEFGFFDAKAQLWGTGQRVVYLRGEAPTFRTTEATYFDHPDWWALDWAPIAARHVWLVEEAGKARAVPVGWRASGIDRTFGYAHVRRFDR